MLGLDYGGKFFYYIFGLAFFFSVNFYSMDLQNKKCLDDNLSKLVLEEKIGQLFMVATVAQSEFSQKEYIDYLINNYHIGGLIFQQLSTPQVLTEAINHHQTVNKKNNKLPLLIGQDLEWGLTMRLVNVVRFPRNMALGAITDDMLLYDMGKEIGRQCKLLGVHVNFAPVVDINTNPANPIIGDRSFGEDKELVVCKGIAIMKGLQDAGTMACAKHFPGHGDTLKDSHLTLPTVLHERERLYSTELYPFSKLINQGVKAVMTAHLDVPALETCRCPASLSRAIVTKLLRDQLKFQGLTVTDGLDMDGVCRDKSAGQVELQALLAGNDILLCSKCVPEAVACIKNAFVEGKLSEQELNDHVKRILYAKQYAIGHSDRTDNKLSSEQLLAQLNTKEAYALKRLLYRQAITLVKNDENIVPLKKGATAIVYVQIGPKEDTSFYNKLTSSFSAIFYHLSVQAKDQEIDTLCKEIDNKTPIVVGLLGMNRFAAQDYGITPAVCSFVDTLCKCATNVILALFGNPYALKWFHTAPSILVAYEDDSDAQDGAADVIAGMYAPKGKLPVSASEKFKAGLSLSYDH